MRAQGKSQWTLTNFLDYRSSKEFVLQAPPEPHCRYVRIDQRASQTLINYCLMTNFACKRVGFLYGKWVPEEGGGGIEVHSIYEVKPRLKVCAPTLIIRVYARACSPREINCASLVKPG